MSAPIEFKDLKKFVLSPAAKFYKTMYENEDCESPEDLANLMSLRFGIEKETVLDFLYDRIHVDEKLARMVLEATGLSFANHSEHYCNSRVEEYLDRCAEFVNLKNAENYTVIGLNELINGNLHITPEDIEQIGRDIDKYVADNYPEKEKLVEIKALLLRAWSILQTAKCCDEIWVAETGKRERDLASRISLAMAVLTQRWLLFNESEHYQTIQKLKEWTTSTETTGCHVSGLLGLLEDIDETVLGNIKDEIDQLSSYRRFSGQKVKRGILPWFVC